MVLFVLDEGVAHLETYVEFPGKEALQKSCLFALQARKKTSLLLLTKFISLKLICFEITNVRTEMLDNNLIVL